MGQHEYIAVMGPTASGKSSLSLALAKQLGGEIINCDSVQIYRGFDIGSAKPSREEMSQCPHHLFDIVDPHQDYDASQFAEAASIAIDDVRQRGRLPILVGGTGLYMRALWGENFHKLPRDAQLREELAKESSEDLIIELKSKDPQRARQIHENDRFRLIRAVEICRLMPEPMSSLEQTKSSSHECLKIKMEVNRSLLHQRIAERTKLMLSAGLIEEVKGLLAKGVSKEAKPMQSIGYKQVCEFLDGRLAESDLEFKIVVATRQYAKRQETWFRKVEMDYLCNDPESAISDIEALL